MSTIHISKLVETNQAYADFPRKGWQDRLILFVQSEGVAEIGVGERLRVFTERPQNEPPQDQSEDLQICVLECPFMRYPAPHMKALHVDAQHQEQLMAIMNTGRTYLERISDA